MTINWLRAGICCDGCGKDFVVALDPATKVSPHALEKGWSLFEYAEDAIRAGEVVSIKPVGKSGAITTTSGLFETSSIQAGKMLCPRCTSIADGIGDDDYQPTAEEITAAIEAAEG